jgi:ubiquinone/menaquinone biosynthesis C-methylase UbiE
MSQSQFDLEAFCNFERTSHDKLAESYYDAFSAVTDGAIEPLLKAAHVGNGTRLLDVATGPGTLAAKAAERGARVIGIDIAPAMIELAHTLHPHLDFREGSAEELPLGSSSFDAVISGFGVGHFSRPERVLAEFARVLVPKGRVALSWWDGFGKSRINGIFFEAINELESVHLARCQPDPQLTDLQTPTNSLRFCVRQALRLLGLITYHSHTRSKALMSFGISRLEALCGYQPSSEPRPPTFSNGYELR